jgi:hypothetical protein
LLHPQLEDATDRVDRDPLITWSLTLREECRLRVFENRVLRRIFERKMDEVTGEWRRLPNKELYAVNSSPDIIRVIRRLRNGQDM